MYGITKHSMSLIAQMRSTWQSTHYASITPKTIRGRIQKEQVGLFVSMVAGIFCKDNNLANNPGSVVGLLKQRSISSDPLQNSIHLYSLAVDQCPIPHEPFHCYSNLSRLQHKACLPNYLLDDADRKPSFQPFHDSS